MTDSNRRRRTAAALAPLLLLAACAQSPAATTIEVSLQEFAVVPSASSAPTGSVTFTVTNEGPSLVHEFVIIRTDLEPGDLPTDENGMVDETADGIEVVDLIEDLPVGEAADLTVDLAAGSYVLVCNVYDADEDTAHYAMGMRTAFTVEGS
jgi:uncharacterized cupredoxin-like copper-binding protein